MKPERWQQIERLYNSALELDPGRRGAFLKQACAGDESVRKEVERLLEFQSEAERFIESPAVGVAARLAVDSSPSKEEQPAPESQPLDDVKSKPRKRAPWWMYALALAFLICAAVRYYGFYIQPENAGIAIQPIKDKSGLAIGVLIKTVLPDSPAAKAGLQQGDAILSSNSGGFISSEVGLAYLYWKSGHTYRIEIQRKEESKTLFLTLSRVRFSDWTGSTKRSLLIVPLFLILAAVLAFRRPYDSAARWGALFFATNAINLIYTAAASVPLGLFSTILLFPRPIAWLTLLTAQFCRTLAISVAITFFAVFPRRLFQRAWIWALVWLPAIYFLTALIRPGLPWLWPLPAWWPFWYSWLYWRLLFVGYCAIPIVLIANYLHLRDLNERRRVRVMVVGFAVSLVAALPGVAIALLGSRSFIYRLFGGIPTNVSFILGCFFCAMPIAMAYAILRHRLFDIRVMIRLGLQYAVARGVLLALVPIVAVVLAGDLLLHGNQPLMQILGQRGLLYAVLAAGGLLLHIRRRIWLDAIGRRFFREHYDAQRVLRAVVEEIREARSFEKVAPRVVSQIEAALHPEFASLLVRQPGEVRYRVMAAQEKAPPPIPADSKLMMLMRVLGKPVEISQSQTGWLRSQLPQQEIEFLRQARLEWLFPICLVEGQTEAFLTMGPKRSEEPYSREDQELLQVIASSLALLLEESPAAAPQGFEECPKCGTCYDTGSGSCRKEGVKLTPQPFPRLLDHRYRFEQRLGEGGMGTVYEAHDTELERRVAVKLIRPDVMENAGAAARFKREAKAAASFTHPNVVTVYDFGVAEDHRAYLVMELLRGSTLRQELSKSGRLPAARASEILSGVCTAVAEAHRQRLLHRDLKPENIFLVTPGGMETAKILDFGVVKPIAPVDTTQSAGQTGSGVLVGTLKYMSPEQLRGEKPAESWDLWALAVVAYEMLAGAHPFDGSTAFDMRDAVLAGRVIPLRKHLPEAPPGWQQFFDRALSPRVEIRPTSVLQLFSDFKQHIR